MGRTKPEFMQENLESQLRTLLTEVCSLPPDFSPTADFYSDLGMPSVKAMQLLLELEDRFGFPIPDEEFVEATTLERLALLIRKIQSSAQP